MIPSFAYPGGKHYQRRWLMGYVPATVSGTYVEPFAGRGNVYWLAARTISASGWWLNDLATAPFFRLLKASTDSELSALVGDEYPPKEHYETLKRTPSEPRAIVMEPCITFSGGGWGQGYRGSKAPTIVGYKSRLIEAAKTLRETDAKITAVDYAEVLSELGAGDFAFVDPPYIGCDVRSYKASAINHKELAASLAGAKYDWVLTEYENEVYTSVLGPPVGTKSEKLKVTGSADFRAMRTECVWVSPALLERVRVSCAGQPS